MVFFPEICTEVSRPAHASPSFDPTGVVCFLKKFSCILVLSNRAKNVCLELIGRISPVCPAVEEESCICSKQIGPLSEQ